MCIQLRRFAARQRSCLARAARSLSLHLCGLCFQLAVSRLVKLTTVTQAVRGDFEPRDVPGFAGG